MEPSNVERFLVKAAEDEEFRKLCLTDPAKALGEFEIEPSKENLEALRDAGEHLDNLKNKLGVLGDIGPLG